MHTKILLQKISSTSLVPTLIYILQMDLVYVVTSYEVYENWILDYVWTQRIKKWYEYAKKSNALLIILWWKCYYGKSAHEEWATMISYLQKNEELWGLKTHLLDNWTSSATQLLELKEYCINHNIKKNNLITDEYHWMYLWYMVEKIFWSEVEIKFLPVDLQITWKYNTLLQQWMLKQLELVKKDREKFIPWDHEAIRNFQLTFEKMWIKT